MLRKFGVSAEEAQHGLYGWERDMLLRLWAQFETEQGQAEAEDKVRLAKDTLSEPPQWVKERSG